MDNVNDARAIKPHLRFDIGDIVYLKSDLKKKCPMTVMGFITMDDYFDYSVSWMNSQRVQERSLFHDKSLTNEQ
ncbi:MAG TPA: hypothetical protein PLR88_08365 [Bacteroidales bacterium]|jgi:hypothetical protein|nr:hypothetical protein [Bacteroidales bacterium]